MLTTDRTNACRRAANALLPCPIANSEAWCLDGEEQILGPDRLAMICTMREPRRLAVRMRLPLHEDMIGTANGFALAAAASHPGGVGRPDANSCEHHQIILLSFDGLCFQPSAGGANGKQEGLVDGTF